MGRFLRTSPCLSFTEAVEVLIEWGKHRPHVSLCFEEIL